MIELNWYLLKSYLVAEVVKNLPVVQEICFQSLAQEDSPGEGDGYPRQHSYLGNPMNRGAWCTMVHRVTKIKLKCFFLVSQSVRANQSIRQ